MEIFPWKIGATPRRREGPPWHRGLPRRGHARLSELGDNGGGIFGPPRQGTARLGEQLCLGKGRLRLGMPTMVRGLGLWPILGSSHGLVCDCCGFLRGSLCDLFECVIAWQRVTCLDVNVCALTC